MKTRLSALISNDGAPVNAARSRPQAMKTRLSLGVQTFRTVREEGFRYVDKTAHAARLIDEGRYYFLSRPRRFGKSLFLDTLKELFEGSEALFEGLYIHSRWDWSACHPVVHLSFGGGNFKDPDCLHADVLAQLDAIERATQVETRYESAPARFRHLIGALHARTGRRVVVLVDEYDKPILDALSTPTVAQANRDYLRGLYGVVKDCDAHVRFCFVTGVSKFSKVNLFSTLNNLDDITLAPTYSTVCGFTEEDLDAVFAPELAGLDRARIRAWYNGYNWGGPERVYNPYDVLRLFRWREFRAWWFETGTPAFLVETLVERGVASVSLDGMVATDELLSAFDVEHIATEALLFQTGYLTICGAEDRGGETFYRLCYPNREVRQSLNRSLLDGLARDPRQTAHRLRLYDLLLAGDVGGLQALFHAVFAGIPYEWHTRNDLSRFEGWYASVFYSYFAASGFDVTVEDSSSRGRVDMAVRGAGRVYLFEFKVVEQAGAGAALAQLRERGYADRYRALGEPIHLVGVEFSREQRNVVAFETAPA